jgi:hypothetical protein
MMLTCELRDRAGEWQPASLNLDAVVDNQNGALVFQPLPEGGEGKAASKEAGQPKANGERLEHIPTRAWLPLHSTTLLQRVRSTWKSQSRYEEDRAQGAARAAIPIGRLEAAARTTWTAATAAAAAAAAHAEDGHGGAAPPTSTSHANVPPPPTPTPITAPPAPALGERDFLLKELLQWFKTEFFTWVDTLPCSTCAGKTAHAGGGAPTATDQRYGAGRVELHQ